MDTNENTQKPKIGRPKGSRNPERIKSKRIRAIQPVIDEMDDLELALLRGLTCHKLALRNGLADESRRKEMDRRNWIIIALDNVDLRLRELGKPGLRTTTQYNEHRTKDDPSLSTIYKVFGNFRTGLVEAGIAAVSRPEAELLRIGGPIGGGNKFDDDDMVKAMAIAFEHNLGRLFSWDSYDDIREMRGGPMPSPNQIVGKNSGKKATRSFEEMRERAIQYILEHPDDYPRAAEYLNKTRTLRSDRIAA